MQRRDDRIQGRLIDFFQGCRAIEPVGETVKRGLFVRASRQDGLGVLARGDVARNFRRTDNLAVLIPHRRHGERYVDEATVLAAADGFKMIDALAAPDASENDWLLVLQILRDDDGDRFADDLLRRITEQPSGARIPADDDAVEVFADDRIVGQFDDARELPARLFALPLLGDVEKRRDPAADVAVRIVLGPIGDVEAAPADFGEVELAFEFHLLASQHLLDIGAQRNETPLAESFRDGLADNLVTMPAHRLRIGIADEAIAQVARAPHQHERRAIDDRMQLRFAGAQRLFDALALGQFLKAADGALDASRWVPERRRIHQHWHPRAIGPLDHQFGAGHGLPGSKCDADRRGIERKRGAIRSVTAEGSTLSDARIVERRRPAPKLDGAPVIADEAAIGATHAKARRNAIQRPLVRFAEDVQAGWRRDGFKLLTTHLTAFPRTERNAGLGGKFHRLQHLMPSTRSAWLLKRVARGDNPSPGNTRRRCAPSR